jgi:RNA polymerase sigma-70 factor (ECF subfamily)
LDRDALLETIVREYSADIARLANRLLGWPGDVDDIVQDVFLAAFTGLNKFRHECDIKSWLFIITINKCRTCRYKKMLRLKFFDKFAGSAVLETDHNANEKQIKDETFECVRKAVKQLPVKYREAVVLKYLQEMKTSDITQILGITENTLNVRLNRARELLGKKLADLTR